MGSMVFPSSGGHVAVKAFVLTMGLVVIAAGAWGVVAFADDDEDERVEKLMEKVHEGRRSPYRQLRAVTEADVPVWPLVDATLPPFDAMRRALLESRDPDIAGSADGYADAVAEIMAAARTRNARALRGAFLSLTESCGDCHFDGGVGGELDD